MATKYTAISYLLNVVSCQGMQCIETAPRQAYKVGSFIGHAHAA